MGYEEPFTVVGYSLQLQGSAQREGEEGATLAAPLAVKGLEDDGVTPVVGEAVRFSVKGELPGVGFGLSSIYQQLPSYAGTTSLVTTTDADGVARIYMELGQGAGSFEVEASWPADYGVAALEKKTFEITSLANAAGQNFQKGWTRARTWAGSAWGSVWAILSTWLPATSSRRLSR